MSKEKHDAESYYMEGVARQSESGKPAIAGHVTPDTPRGKLYEYYVDGVAHQAYADVPHPSGRTGLGHIKPNESQAKS